MKQQSFLLILALLSISSYNYIEAKTQSIKTKSLIANTDTIIDGNLEKSETVYDMADQAPEFPGGMKAAIEYLTKNIKYSEEVQKIRIQGRTVVQMIIRSNGKVSDIKIIRSIHPDLDKEIIRIFESMPLWNPGKINGKAVNVKYIVPAYFKPGPQAPQGTDLHSNDNMDDLIFMTSEQSPEFPGGQKELNKYIKQHIKKWKSSQHKKERGQVIIRFIVRKDGNIEDICTIQGVSPTLDAEAVRIISQMPKWEPGKERGEPISMYHTIPITFK